MISLFRISRSRLSLILLDTTDDLLLENYEVKIGMADAWLLKMKIKDPIGSLLSSLSVSKFCENPCNLLFYINV